MLLLVSLPGLVRRSQITKIRWRGVTSDKRNEGKRVTEGIGRKREKEERIKKRKERKRQKGYKISETTGRRKGKDREWKMKNIPGRM